MTHFKCWNRPCAIAYMSDDLVATHLAAGELESVFDAWAPPLPDLHHYYPDRTHQTRPSCCSFQHMRH